MTAPLELTLYCPLPAASINLPRSVELEPGIATVLSLTQEPCGGDGYQLAVERPEIVSQVIAELPRLWAARAPGAVVVLEAASETPDHRWRGALSRSFVRVLGIPLASCGLLGALLPPEIVRILSQKLRCPPAHQKARISEQPSLIELCVHAYAEGYAIRSAGQLAALRSNVAEDARGFFRLAARLWTLRNSVESADYDHRAFSSAIPLQRYWQRRRHRIILGYLRGRGAILDVGCGSSRIIQTLPEAVAFDYAARKLRYLRPTNRLRVRGSTHALPFATAVFDQVIHSQVLEHVPYDEGIFREVNRVMKIGGTFVVGTPDYGRIWWPITEYCYQKVLPNAYADEHITHYTFPSLSEVLIRHGFKVLDHAYICGGELIMQTEKIAECR